MIGRYIINQLDTILYIYKEISISRNLCYATLTMYQVPTYSDVGLLEVQLKECGHQAP